MAKRIQHGFAAHNGLFAALTSRKGYTGIDQVFERPYGGYLTMFGQGSRYDPPFLAGELIDGLGKDGRGMDGIRVKTYNSMIATHAPILNYNHAIQSSLCPRRPTHHSPHHHHRRPSEHPLHHGRATPRPRSPDSAIQHLKSQL